MAFMLSETDAGTRDSRRSGSSGSRGVVVVFSGSTPVFLPVALNRGPLRVGRAGPLGEQLPDTRLSREHVDIACLDEVFSIVDWGSRNGTFVDGERIHGEVQKQDMRVIRAGDTLIVPCDDIERASLSAQPNSPVMGSRLRLALDDLDRAASGSDTLLVLGETGTGKELLARRYHDRGPNAAGPFVAVNCAAIPSGLAERLLFGAKKGSYSGATHDSIGHVQAADRGSLSRRGWGARLAGAGQAPSRPRDAGSGPARRFSRHARVDSCVRRDASRPARRRCAGPFPCRLVPSHRAAGDCASPSARTARRNRGARRGGRRSGLSESSVHASLVETCLLRRWPGNVRELWKHVREAALCAREEGHEQVRKTHLSPSAGAAFSPGQRDVEAPNGDAGAKQPRGYVRWSQTITREVLERTLEECHGNVSQAARKLGMGRAQVYREMARLSVRAR